jgi:precorrin-6A/cobalt-precorrin-6A reductase
MRKAETRPRVVILGGTTEARALAAALAARHGKAVEIVTSQAGRTTTPRRIAGTLRRGSLGGAAGLARFLALGPVAALIDATHPFAQAMKRNAAVAAAESGVPLLALHRPAWPRRAGDRWTEVDDAAAAVCALARLGSRVFLTTGQRDLARFAALRERFFLVRVIERPAEFPFTDGELVLARGPFRVADEVALMRRARIDVLVTKASGGRATYAKIAAARRLGIPVVMIRRALPPAVAAVDSVAAALAWVEQRLRATRRRLDAAARR